MRYWVLMIGLAATVGVGCSGSPALNTAPLVVFDPLVLLADLLFLLLGQRGGSGTATPAKKKRR